MESTPFFPGRYAEPSWEVRRSFPGGTASFLEGTLVIHGGYALSSPTVRRQEGGRHGALSWGVRRFLGPEGRRERRGFIGGTPFPGRAGLPGAVPGPVSWQVRRSPGRPRAGAFMGGTPFRRSPGANGATGEGAFMEGTPLPPCRPQTLCGGANHLEAAAAFQYARGSSTRSCAGSRPRA